jgi:catechol-2,3-dioxygenase
MDRRKFLEGATAAMALVPAHGTIAAWQGQESAVLPRQKVIVPRISGLELLTSVPLAKMNEFYHQSLGLPLLEEESNRLIIGAGATRVAFVKVGQEEGQPFYHFAFNIPENKILAARSWQKERTALLPIPARLRDSAYPEDVVDYRHWNAHSIFFFDPAGNVVEYIARHDLKNAEPGAFDVKDILYASEIGFIVDDVPATSAELKEVVGIDQYRGGSDQFTALGDEHGLLLIMKRGRILSFDSPQKKAASVFGTTASVRGARRSQYLFPGFPYKLAVGA